MRKPTELIYPNLLEFVGVDTRVFTGVDNCDLINPLKRLTRESHRLLMLLGMARQSDAVWSILSSTVDGNQGHRKVVLMVTKSSE